MSKIGIMSMQRICNYGSYLQSYALKKIIESLNHEVEFIDYEFEKSVILEKKEIFSKFIKNKNIVQFLKKRSQIKKFKNAYNNEFLPKLGITEKNYNKKIDTLVIGSDEVFNCLQPYPVGYSRNLFGFGYNKSNVISYAACFGFTTYEGLKKHGIDKEISNLLKKFKAISVRDNNSLETVKKLTGQRPVVNLDPVLIYDFKINKKIDIELSDYIIIYAYPGRLTKEEEKYIKKFARKHNKKILSLGSYQKIADVIKIVEPLDIFSYFKKASYVITDTFHGSIFAIKTQTKFCTIIRNSNNNKLGDLLAKLSLETRKVNELDEIEKLYNEEIDFSKTNDILSEERKKTYDYLEKNL